jgi:hypothetical protein
MPNPVINRRLAAARSLDVFPGPPPGLWLDASQLTGLVDGNSITTWVDVSGNGRDFTQATAASKPTFKTTVKNGKPCGRFDGGDLMNCATMFSAQTWTFFVVLSFSAINTCPFTSGTTNDCYSFYSDANRSIQLRNGGGFTNISDAAYTVGTVENWTIRRNNTGPLLEFWNNGISRTLSAPAAAQGSPGSAAILGAFAGPVAPFSGDLFELIGYASLLTDPQRAAIERYLQRKYDLI